MQTIQLSYEREAYPAVLSGGGAFAGYGSALMRPAAGVGAVVEQVIALEFMGTGAEIESGQKYINRFLEHAAAYAAQSAGEPVYLECQVTAEGPLWRSPVYSGWLELNRAGVDQRSIGMQGGTLHLVRANWWERSEEIQLANAVTVTNHRDEEHANHIYLSGDPNEEDLPGRVRLQAALSSAVTAPGYLFVGQRSGSSGGQDLFYEGQDGAVRAGVTGTTLADANSSGGSYYNLAWSGASETALWQVDVSSIQVGLARNTPLRVMMRLADGNPSAAAEKLWVRWAVVYVDAGGGERTLFETAGSYLPNSTELVLGPIIYLPPWYLASSAPGLRVVLKATAAGSGAHALKLDYVEFCNLSGWRYYEPLLQSYGVSVNDAGLGGVTGPAGGVITHAMEGPGFVITPGHQHQFLFYWALKEAGETSASANLAGTVSIFYRPRRRML